jgi:hypothetical protein
MKPSHEDCACGKQKDICSVVAVLIDNIVPAIKINASLHSVPDIHDHLEKYETISGGWNIRNLPTDK